MGNGLFSQLDIGKRSLMAQQAGMGVAGHNVANVNNEGYSRQRVELEEQHPRRSKFGAGVDIEAVGRVTDRFTNERLIGEQTRLGNLDVREKILLRLEQIFNETEGTGLRATLNEFWAAWGDVANQPESELFRAELITRTNLLTRKFGEQAKELDDLRTQLNGRISQDIEVINQLSLQLARQNMSVQQTDRGHGEANDLFDARESTLKELSRLIQLEWFEDESGLIQVTVGSGWPLVAGRRANRLEASLKNEELGMFRIRGIDPQGISRDITDEVRGGQLKELFNLRDQTVRGFSGRLDELAAELAFKVNQLHATGTGINARHEKLRSSFALKPDALVRPLPFLKDGLFRVHMVNENNAILETYEVEIKAGRDTLPDIVNRINAAVGDPSLFRTVLNGDGSVTLESGGPFPFVLGDDETDFAVVMGFNNFLDTLRGARDISINPRLEREPNSISAGKRLVPGDNSVALKIHALQFLPSMQDDSITFDEFYNGVLAELGLIVQRSQTEKRNQELIVHQFQKLRDEVSSVNMDEEVADMVQYQRGFDAAAKFISTIDEMTRTIIDM
ncbi:MAG: flagellar hook-associated protein FlgK [bacterium]